MDLKKYSLRMKSAGKSIRDEKIISSQNMLESVFSEDPAYYNVQNWKTGQFIGARIYDQKHRSSSTSQCEIQTLINCPIYEGDVFCNKDDFWICVEGHNEHDIIYKGILEHCNYLLKFMIDDKIYTYPVELKNATQYNSGETHKEQITLGSSQYLCLISIDDKTIKIDRGQRFIIDNNTVNPTVFRVNQVDSVTFTLNGKGILQWTLVEDQFSSERDNKELMIADYYKNKESEGWC